MVPWRLGGMRDWAGEAGRGETLAGCQAVVTVVPAGQPEA